LCEVLWGIPVGVSWSTSGREGYGVIWGIGCSCGVGCLEEGITDYGL
jgi:hypothetical protein